MKVFALLTSIIVFLCISSACSKIETVKDPTDTSLTLQAENKPEELLTIETTTTAAATEETTTPPSETATAAAATVTTAATTPITTTAPPPPETTVIKAAVTTPVVTTTPKVTTTAVTTTTPTATTPAPPPVTLPNISGSSYNALNFPQQNAMWISFLEFQRILKGKSESSFRTEVQKMYDDCKSMGINTVYVHARGHSDAYYKSDLYPWSKNCTGTIDVDPGFDPFQILVDEAHARGLSIHAWINPMRGLTDSDIKKISDKYPIKQWYNDPSKRGEYIVLVNGTWYCSPAYKEVRDMITNGAKEIVSRYNVDGIHIDDYFYPTTESSFDKKAFANSGSKNLTAWRLDTVSTMVRELYSGIKSINSSVLFGVSPQGNIDNNYRTQYADVRKWCSTPGYLDYLVPQIYFGFKNTVQPYATNLQAWCDMITAPNIQLVVGLAPYKLGTDDKANEWKNDKRILARQVETFQEKNLYGGSAYFRYDSLFVSPSAQMKEELAYLKEILK